MIRRLYFLLRPGKFDDGQWDRSDVWAICRRYRLLPYQRRGVWPWRADPCGCVTWRYMGRHVLWCSDHAFEGRDREDR